MSDPNRHFSAVVNMHLHANGRTLSVGRAGPNYCELREPAKVSGRATLVISIDGREHVYHIEIERIESRYVYYKKLGHEERA